MPIKMLFEYRFLIYFIKTFRDNLDTLLINHKYQTRSHSQNLLKTHKFRTTKGQRSMLHTGVGLFNKYFKNSDFQSLTPSYVRGRLAAGLWDSWSLPALGQLSCCLHQFICLTNLCFHRFFVVLLSDSHRASKTVVSDYLVAPIAFMFTFFVLNIVVCLSDSCNKLN